MQLNNGDLEELKKLSNSMGWKIVCNELQERIADIDEVLTTPGSFDYLPVEKQLDAVKIKQYERTYLTNLVSLPLELIGQQISPIDISENLV